jgi:hypothetical protein
MRTRALLEKIYAVADVGATTAATTGKAALDKSPTVRELVRDARRRPQPRLFLFGRHPGTTEQYQISRVVCRLRSFAEQCCPFGTETEELMDSFMDSQQFSPPHAYRGDVTCRIRLLFKLATVAL